MTIGEAISELVKYDESMELLIFPEGIELDDEENEVYSAGGIAVFDGKELQYLGDVQFIQEIYDEEGTGFYVDDMDDDELDIEFEEENLN